MGVLDKGDRWRRKGEGVLIKVDGFHCESRLVVENKQKGG